MYALKLVKFVYTKISPAYNLFARKRRFDGGGFAHEFYSVAVDVRRGKTNPGTDDGRPFAPISSFAFINYKPKLSPARLKMAFADSRFTRRDFLQETEKYILFVFDVGRTALQKNRYSFVVCATTNRFSPIEPFLFRRRNVTVIFAQNAKGNNKFDFFFLLPYNCGLFTIFIREGGGDD